MLYAACTVLAGKNIVNTVCTDNSSEWMGSLGIGLVNESFIFKAAELYKISLQSPMTVQHQLEVYIENHCQ